MVSAIDPSKPVDGVPAVKADLRANLLAAKNEIEALQTVAAASVKQFGAVGDGSTDDLDAFQNAIDAVSGDGGIVFVPASPDPYIIDGTLALKANVILAGEYAGSILKLADGANTTLVAATGTTPLFGMRDLVLDCNRIQQNGDFSKFGLNIAVANTNGGYGPLSSIGGVLTDPFYKIENIMIVEVDGCGVQATGAHGHFRSVEVVQTNAEGIRAQSNDTSWSNCTVGGCGREGFLCAGGSARYNDCKAFFCGTGRDALGTSYGNYPNGHGFRITSRGQHFVNCQAQDIDGWGFSVQANDIIIAGAYIDQACQLESWSAFLGQNPVRGGGFALQKAGINLQGASNCNIQCLVTARGVVNSQIDPELEGILRLNGSSSNNVVTLGYTAGILAGGGVEVLKVSHSGSNNRVLTPSGLLVP
jgi:hypothetical protein